jgi:hypothetical protein
MTLFSFIFSLFLFLIHIMLLTQPFTPQQEDQKTSFLAKCRNVSKQTKNNINHIKSRINSTRRFSQIKAHPMLTPPPFQYINYTPPPPLHPPAPVSVSAPPHIVNYHIHVYKVYQVTDFHDNNASLDDDQRDSSFYH